MLYLTAHSHHLQNKCFLILIFFFLNFNICYLYSNECIYFLIRPLLYTSAIEYLIITEITEIFFLQIFISLVFSIFFSIGFLFLQLSLFFTKGCYKLENLKIFNTLIFFLFTFYFNNYIIFNFFIPIICDFFIETGKFSIVEENLQQFFFEPKLSNYLLLIIKSTILSNILIQYPFLIFYLLIIGFFRVRWLIKYRKIFYIKIWGLTAVLSPPDIFTPIIISCFLISFFEINVCIYIYFNSLKRIFFKK